MKTRIILLSMLATAVLSCEEDSKVVDPVYEFIAFKGTPSVNVNEHDNVNVPVPVVVQLSAFKPYPEDITVTYEVIGNNVAENIDFTIAPAGTLKIKAGSLVSDTLWIRTIDNSVGTAEGRSFDLKIKSVSKDIRIGLGIAQPKNAFITVNILDDECSGSPLCIYNTTLSAVANGSSATDIATILDKNNGKLTLTGNLMDYSTFPNASITVTLTPDGEGSSTGTATFGEQEAGTDNDGYRYKFVETAPGTYDATAGTIHLEFDNYYMEGGNWVYWYSVTNDLSVP